MTWRAVPRVALDSWLSSLSHAGEPSMGGPRPVNCLSREHVPSYCPTRLPGRSMLYTPANALIARPHGDGRAPRWDTGTSREMIHGVRICTGRWTKSSTEKTPDRSTAGLELVASPRRRRRSRRAVMASAGPVRTTADPRIQLASLGAGRTSWQASLLTSPFGPYSSMDSLGKGLS